MAAKKSSVARRRARTGVAARKKAPAPRRRTPARTAARAAPEAGGMTVREAGRKGGLVGGRKGGETVKAARGVGFYKEIGRKGGQRVRELIEAGRQAMERAEKRTGRR